MPVCLLLWKSTFNRFDGPTNLDSVGINGPASYSSVPANIHGEKVFLVKLQIGLSLDAMDVMIYDRQRSFGEVYFAKNEDAQLFADMKAEMRGPRGGFKGVKMYRYAKRVSDWKLNLCLDRATYRDQVVGAR
ncbi:hypothetical protein POSPLADRAFT_1158641 [Postia placenta MAD-698-R-SB12]|uniref:Uncharacterized protein n=1 Tax=Postia placenta MAD-698-R-SB12 TaxID=670580 RepID=A0A1X6ML03_9APHY|nr:hypothetical protein POSPLADRAFT_1158641 [Postia placenta MAD-698-R-SB12]OSX56733.1 hypothetical protein POSPLADRAFT_1158641 [Postia placenta MAD-698-R-SB12]